MRIFSRETATIGASIALGVVGCLLLDFLVITPLMEDPESGFRRGYRRFDDGWYTLTPSVRVASGWGKTVYPWRTDAEGFRIDHRKMPSRPADTIILGDSFAFGVGLPWEETFVGMYERATGKSIINAGVPSYSPTGYLWQYQHALSAGLLRTPHTVIVALDISDVQDEAAIWEDGKLHPKRRQWDLVSSESRFPTERSAIRGFLSSHLLGTRSVYRTVRYELWKREVEQPAATSAFDLVRSAFTWRSWNEIEPGVVGEVSPYQDYAQTGYRPLGVRGGLDRVRDKLARISAIANENRSDLWILIHPWPAQLHHPSRVFDWEKFATDTCSEFRCRGVIDTFPRFRSLSQTDGWYERLFIRGDVHFTKFVADKMVVSLQELQGKSR
jgi:hypothetical protein